MDLLSHWTHLVSNIAGMLEHNQIQDPGVQRGLRTDAVVKLWAFAIRDQNRDGFIEERPEGHLDVGNDELNEMIKECSGILNFTLFLNMFGEKLKGTDPEEAILNAFKVFDRKGTVVLRGEEIKYHLVSQADKFTEDEVNHMFTNFPLKVASNFDYKNACYVITHGEDKEQE